MTPLWLAALWGACLGAGVTGPALVWWHRRALRALWRAWDTERGSWQRWVFAIDRQMREGIAHERQIRERLERLVAALREELQEQDGEAWKRGRRPAELDDRDRQGH